MKWTILFLSLILIGCETGGSHFGPTGEQDRPYMQWEFLGKVENPIQAYRRSQRTCLI